MAADRRLPRWAAWALAAAFLVTAWFVALATPGEEQAQSPFVVTAAIDEPATGRNLEATVVDIRRAAEVRAHDGRWAAEGNWVVVDLEVAAVTTERFARLGHAMLEIDGVRYSASDRPASLVRAQLAAGIPQTGSLAFELPADLDSGHAVLELALRSDTRLDSMIVLPFDVADAARVARAELGETGWANP
ncbi:hypothetical protein ACFC1I_19810 [Microbacterium sp. NPDC056044]|uniref:hypothetical protein n=1 Tax=Microbacterium sp. NPDC056044 TaxID=3345690 RepID=UPI0035D64299